MDWCADHSRCLSTKRRPVATTPTIISYPPRIAVNRSGVDRYAVAFFCDAGIDWPIAGAPTHIMPDKPPKYPTTRYTEYMIDYQ
jgi:isopenicillin N synthase-like dioxygenase